MKEGDNNNISFAVKVLGFKGSDIAKIMGVSRQRISFITKEPMNVIEISQEEPDDTSVIDRMIESRQKIHINKDGDKYALTFKRGVFYLVGRDGKRLRITKIDKSKEKLIDCKFDVFSREDLVIIRKYETDGEAEVINTLKSKGMSKKRASHYMRYLGIG